MQKQLYVPLLFALLTISALAKAEVEEVSITWNAFKCQSSCVSEMEKSLGAIHEVTNLKVNPGGFAIMKWSPTSPFSYEPFRYAAAAVGLRISSMRVRVKGKVVLDGGDFYLISDGDNTKFLLIGPLLVEPGRYSPSNISTHPLTLPTRQQLESLNRSTRGVIITGPLLLPSFYRLALITEQIKEQP